MESRPRELLETSARALIAQLSLLPPEAARPRAGLLLDIGRIQRATGSGDEAEDTFLEALALAKATGEHRLDRRASVELGACLAARGDPSAGLRYLESSLEAARQSGDPHARLDLATAAAELALARERAGDPTGADAALAIAREAASAAPGASPRVELRAADILAGRGDTTAACEAYARAFEAAAGRATEALERATVELGASEGIERVPPARVTSRELEALAPRDLAALWEAGLSLARTPPSARATRAAELALALSGAAGVQVSQGGRALAAVGAAREGALEVRQGGLALRLVPAPDRALGERERLIARALLASLEDDPAGTGDGAEGTAARVLALLDPVLEAGLDLERLVAIATDMVVEATGAARGVVLLRHAGEQLGFRTATARGEAAMKLVSRTLVREAFLSGRPILLADAAADVRVGGATSIHEQGLRSVLVAPISGADGIALGLLYLDDPGTTGRFGAAELEVAIGFARRLGPPLRAAFEVERARAASAADAADGVAARFGEIVGRSRAALTLRHSIARALGGRAPVLISGESGTGKELVARALHTHGPRAGGPFVAVSCAALADSVLGSELFGHAKGAFTGAASEHPGLFRRAHGGVLFLDELQDASPRLQAELLRVLETGEVRPLGSDEVRKVDVRTVAATNADLGALVLAGRFREDLFYRLHVIHVRVPSLDERREDIPDLVAHFLARAGVDPRRLVALALARILEAPWTGNVRGLRNCLERAVALAGKGPIQAEHIVLETLRRPPAQVLGKAAAVELNGRQLSAIARLRETSHLGNAEHSLRSGVTQQTGWRDLTDLVAKGVLVRSGRGKSTFYRLAPGWESRVPGPL